MSFYVEPPTHYEIKKALYEELINRANEARLKSHASMQDKIRKFTAKLIREGDFIDALYGPELRGSFGIRPNEFNRKINAIIKLVSEDTHLFTTPLSLAGGNNIVGGWLLAMGTNLFQDLKSSFAGITITEKRQQIPWLKWTLEIGNKVIISNFRVKFQLGKGRSGYAFMVPNAIVGYRVPPQFAGTDHDNWITRDIIPHLDEYGEIISRTLDRYAK